MSRIRLYFDEDVMQQSLVFALRARHVDIVTALDCMMINRSDEAHLLWATEDGRALYSFNIRDYSSIHQRWLAGGRTHAGIVLARQQHYAVGEQLRRLLRLINRVPAETMTSRLEYLSLWGR